MILYHVTASKNVAGILKQGLIPQIGAYAKEMGETEALVWLFPSLEKDSAAFHASCLKSKMIVTQGHRLCRSH